MNIKVRTYDWTDFSKERITGSDEEIILGLRTVVKCMEKGGTNLTFSRLHASFQK
jgi:hypothetical protein